MFAPQRPTGTSVTYVCGSCGTSMQLKLKDAIRCVACGYRILYKPRQKAITLEAR